MNNVIIETVMGLPTPEKYDDHRLSCQLVTVSHKEKKKLEEKILFFFDTNQIAKRMVAKWFQRNKIDGSFNMTLIQERGNYNATQEDLAKALQTKRGKAMLADAGEQLIGNTFLIINDIRYIDKEENAKIASAIFSVFAAIVGSNSSLGQLLTSANLSPI